MREPIRSKMLYVNPECKEMWNRSCNTLYGKPSSWISADALLNILNGMRDFFRIEAGKLTLKIVSCSLREAFAPMPQLCTLRAHATGMTLGSQATIFERSTAFVHVDGKEVMP
jgi:signal transduction histidine kinase